MRNLFRNAFGGGGNLEDAGLDAKTAFEAVKVGRHCYADNETDLEAKMPRGIEAKSVTEINFANSGDEHESIVGWGCYPNNENYDNSCNSRHSERIAKESSLLQYKAVAKNENNSTETDHASEHLGIFTSKSVFHKTNIGGVGTPPYVAKNLAAWLPSRLAAKRVAFTLAEVLITLGIIGVVAAMTLPTLIQNNQKKQFQIGLQKGYSELLQALDAYKNDKGEPLTLKDCYGQTPGIFKNLIKPYLKVLVDCGDSQADSNYDKCVQNGYYSQDKKYTYKTYSGKKASDGYLDDGQLILTDGAILLFENPLRSTRAFVSIDVNGFKKGPNQWGVDLFTFQLMEDGKLLPMGMAGTYYAFQDVEYCSKVAANSYNGIACTARALYDKDFWK